MMTPDEIRDLVGELAAGRSMTRIERNGFAYALQSSGLTMDGALALLAKLTADPELTKRPLRPSDISLALGAQSVLEDRPEPGDDWNPAWENVLAATRQHGLGGVRSAGVLDQVTTLALTAIWPIFTTQTEDKAMWAFRREYTAIAAGQIDIRHQPRLPTGTAPEIHQGTDDLEQIAGRQNQRAPELRAGSTTGHAGGTILQLVQDLKPQTETTTGDGDPAAAEA